MNGGTDDNPVYYIGSPIFDKVTIQLHPDFYMGETLTIETKNNGTDRVFVSKAWLNNEPLEDLKVSHGQLTNGSHLILEMVGN